MAQRIQLSAQALYDFEHRNDVLIGEIPPDGVGANAIAPPSAEAAINVAAFPATDGTAIVVASTPTAVETAITTIPSPSAETAIASPSADAGMTDHDGDHESHLNLTIADHNSENGASSH